METRELFLHNRVKVKLGEEEVDIELPKLSHSLVDILFCIQTFTVKRIYERKNHRYTYFLTRFNRVNLETKSLLCPQGGRLHRQCPLTGVNIG